MRGKDGSGSTSGVIAIAEEGGEPAERPEDKGRRDERILREGRLNGSSWLTGVEDKEERSHS